MDHNKAPGSVGFSAEFYQTFWDVTKKEILARFAQLQVDHLPFFELNFGRILLSRKKMRFKYNSMNPFAFSM
jgi:hypothetical protein